MSLLYYLFREDQLLHSGGLTEVALHLHAMAPGERAGTLLFDGASGAELDLDLRGSEAEVRQRYPEETADETSPTLASSDTPEVAAPETPRKRGRPKLGVVGREITLLPRHWQWLDTQRGGASATLRRLVDQARKALAAEDAARIAQDRTQRLITALAGNKPGFEEAVRALYARDRERFEREIADWPSDVRRLAMTSAREAFVPGLSASHG